MKRSKSITKLSEALAKSQSEYPPFVNNRSGYNFQYLDLAGILKIALPILGKNGLSVIQESGFLVKGDVPYISVLTLLSCEDEFIENYITFPMILPSKNTDTDIGCMGSTISYLRRYALQAMLGVYGNDEEVEQIVQENNNNNGEQNELD